MNMLARMGGAALLLAATAAAQATAAAVQAAAAAQATAPQATVAPRPVPALQPVMPIAGLNGAALAQDEALTVQGVVTRTDGPLFVQDASGATEVDSAVLAPSLRLGDEVQVTGTVTHGLFGARFLQASIHLLGPSVPYPPLAITPSMAASGRYQRRFIVTEGVLLSVQREQQTAELLLERGHQRFVAELPRYVSAEVLGRLQKGSIMRIRGVCLVADGSAGSMGPALVPFRILMQADDDMEQIAAPPFWTRGHILVLSAVLMLCAYLGLVFYLRLERWRFHLILEERARVAHDLHDTLAQSFAGINFQLQALRKASAPFAEQVQTYLDLAISMVSHSHEDARRSIAMLKATDFDTGNLIDNLRLQGEQLTQGGDLTFCVLTEGEQRTLPREVEQLLLRIGHEAITNAIAHASAKRITIQLRYEPGSVQLSIADDGVGLAAGRAAGQDGLPPHGYGIAGMRARARAAGGSFRVSSDAGTGTTVHVSVPVSRRASPNHFSLLRGFRGWWHRV